MNYWIIPANPKRYRLADVVRELPFVDWRQHNNFEVGDIVYIYNSRPDSQILYKMEGKKGKLTEGYSTATQKCISLELAMYPVIVFTESY